MNNSNSTSPTELLKGSVYAAGEILGYYVIPITALITSLAYIVSGIILWKMQLIKKTNYCLLFCKIINISLVSTLFIGYQNNNCIYCPDRVYNTYISQAYSQYCLKYIFRIFAMSHALIDIIMVYDRFCLLRNKQSSFFKIPPQYLFLITLLVPTLLRFPDYLAYSIEYSKEVNAFYIALTPIGKAKWYIFYRIALNFVFYGFSLTLFSIITIVNLTDYRDWAHRKKKIINKKNEKIKIKKSEAAFTRMVTFTSIIGAVAIFYNLITFIIGEINTLMGIKLNLVANLNQTISYEIIFFAWVFDIYLYFSIDKNLRNFVSKIFKLCK